MAKIEAYRQRMGWNIPWFSSYGTDFNHDFGAGYTDAEQAAGTGRYNYADFDLKGTAEFGSQQPAIDWAATTGTDWVTYTKEAPGMSAFVLEDGVVYHTYSAYARGLDALWGMYQWLDRAPRGRNEDRGDGDPLNWFRRHDEYGAN
jgi:predicted dithiol-disulfide oxidoreductase (DUF899 family)